MRRAEIFLIWGEFRGICPRFHQFVEEHLDRGTFPWKMPQIQSATVVFTLQKMSHVRVIIEAALQPRRPKVHARIRPGRMGYNCRGGAPAEETERPATEAMCLSLLEQFEGEGSSRGDRKKAIMYVV